METVSVQVSPDLIAALGKQALAEQLQQFVAWKELSIKAQALKQTLDEAGIDWEEVAKEARQQAWQTYKYTIKDKLPPEAFEPQA